jgi:hypothetical protein
VKIEGEADVVRTEPDPGAEVWQLTYQGLKYVGSGIGMFFRWEIQ